jgi:hypothetical protein
MYIYVYTYIYSYLSVYIYIYIYMYMFTMSGLTTARSDRLKLSSQCWCNGNTPGRANATLQWTCSESIRKRRWVEGNTGLRHQVYQAQSPKCTNNINCSCFQLGWICMFVVFQHVSKHADPVFIKFQNRRISFSLYSKNKRSVSSCFKTDASRFHYGSYQKPKHEWTGHIMLSCFLFSGNMFFLWSTAQRPLVNTNLEKLIFVTKNVGLFNYFHKKNTPWGRMNSMNTTKPFPNNASLRGFNILASPIAIFWSEARDRVVGIPITIHVFCLQACYV